MRQAHVFSCLVSLPAASSLSLCLSRHTPQLAPGCSSRVFFFRSRYCFLTKAQEPQRTIILATQHCSLVLQARSLAQIAALPKNLANPLMRVMQEGTRSGMPGRPPVPHRSLSRPSAVLLIPFWLLIPAVLCLRSLRSPAITTFSAPTIGAECDSPRSREPPIGLPSTAITA